MGGDGHFFSDLVEGFVIWEADKGADLRNAPVTPPIEAAPELPPQQTQPAEVRATNAIDTNAVDAAPVPTFELQALSGESDADTDVVAAEFDAADADAGGDAAPIASADAGDDDGSETYDASTGGDAA